VGIENETAQSNLDIVNHDVRDKIAAAERAAARSSDPAATFSQELANQVLGPEGLRNRYLGEADAGRATFDATGPVTSADQASILSSGRFSLDVDGSPGDGDSSFKKR
jgi:conjugal transfer mating pair stabilization protein TraG